MSTKSAATLKLPNNSAVFYDGTGAFSTPSGSGGAVQITRGTRASLPGSGTATGDMYLCSDSPYQYYWDGSNWQAYIYGQPVTEPSGLTKINSGPTTTLVTTYGGYQFGATGAGDQVVSYVQAVTPSSTLQVALGYQYPKGAQVGICIYNSNNNKVYFFRQISATGYNFQFFKTLYTSDGASISTPNANIAGGSATLDRRVWPDATWIFRFDSTNLYIDIALDSQAAFGTENIYSEALTTNIGTNYTHVGFAVNLGSNNIWGQHLKILHT